MRWTDSMKEVMVLNFQDMKNAVNDRMFCRPLIQTDKY